MGTLIGIDPDHYGEESLLTQSMLWRDRGRAKAWVQGAKAHAVPGLTYIVQDDGIKEVQPGWFTSAIV